MDVFQSVETRRSIRKYKPLSIPENHLRKILEAARLALLLETDSHGDS